MKICFIHARQITAIYCLIIVKYAADATCVMLPSKWGLSGSINGRVPEKMQGKTIPVACFIGRVDSHSHLTRLDFFSLTRLFLNRGLSTRSIHVDMAYDRAVYEYHSAGLSASMAEEELSPACVAWKKEL